MKALSILQPWAWVIVRPDITDELLRAQARAEHKIKPVENRTWRHGYRGRCLIHAGKAYKRTTHDEYAQDFVDIFGITLPPFEQMQLGGFVGSTEVVDCVRSHGSPWSAPHQYQFVLKDTRPERFTPWRGQLGFFDVPDDVLVAPAPQGTLL